MKKTLVILLALVFVLSIGATALASGNPFVDVPATSWAAGAINKLVAAVLSTVMATALSMVKKL